MDQKRFEKQLDFIIEIDKLKSINRVTLLLDSSRNENSAEHSWHIAILALLLNEYAKDKVDVFKVIKMLLVHDIVEIDAGDTFLYSAEGNKVKAENEIKAADRIFSILPQDHALELKALWQEFEKGESAESKFAKAVDRIQPMLHNYLTKGVQWKNNNVTGKMVLEKNKIIDNGTNDIWGYMKELIADAVNKGWLDE